MPSPSRQSWHRSEPSCSSTLASGRPHTTQTVPEPSTNPSCSCSVAPAALVTDVPISPETDPGRRAAPHKGSVTPRQLSMGTALPRRPCRGYPTGTSGTAEARGRSSGPDTPSLAVPLCRRRAASARPEACQIEVRAAPAERRDLPVRGWAPVAALVPRLALVTVEPRGLTSSATLVARLALVAQLAGPLIVEHRACRGQGEEAGEQESRSFALHQAVPPSPPKELSDRASLLDCAAPVDAFGATPRRRVHRPQTPNGRCRARTSDLLLVKAGSGSSTRYPGLANLPPLSRDFMFTPAQP